jgi:hypothetical protein
MVHVDVSQLPVSRQPSDALVVSYPVSQTREAFDPYVVVVNVTLPLLTLKEEPQSERNNYIVKGKHYDIINIIYFEK